MSEDKRICGLCQKEIDDFWCGGDVNGKEMDLCPVCATQVLMQQQWQY